MASSAEPEVPVEKPDPDAVARPSERSEARPGFSLGGTGGEEGDGELPEGGPVDDTKLGASRATGGSELTNARGVKG